MSHARRAALATLLLLASAGTASADWVLTPFAGVTARGRTGYFDPDDAATRSRLAMGISLSRTWGRFGAEAEVVTVPGFFTGDDGGLITSSGVMAVTGSAIVNLPALGRVRPYAVAGLGAVRVTMEDTANLFPVSEWQPAAAAGAGVIVPVSGRFSLRGDARLTLTRRGDGSDSSIGFGEVYVDFWRVTAGLAIAIR